MGQVFSNLALRAKLMLIAVTFIIMTVPAFTLSYFTIEDQSAVMQVQLLPAFADQNLLSDLLLAVSESGGALNKAVALANGSASDARIKELIKECKGQLDTVDMAFGKLRGATVISDNQDTAINDTAAKFLKAVEDLLDMLDGDPVTALTMLENTFSKYSLLRASVDAIVDKQSKVVSEIKNAAERDTKKADEFLLIVGLLAYLISFIAVFFIARSMTTGVGCALHVMNKLSEGNLALNIPYPNREDNVGQIFQGLQVFKDKAFEKIHLEQIKRQENDAKLAHGEHINALTRNFEGAANLRNQPDFSARRKYSWARSSKNS